MIAITKFYVAIDVALKVNKDKLEIRKITYNFKSSNWYILGKNGQK